MTSITGVATDFIQFTRASNATVTDSDGKVKWAPHNLLRASEQFDSVSWDVKTGVTFTANSTAAPNGTTTADTIAFASFSYDYQRYFHGSALTGVTMTFGIWLWSATGKATIVVRLAGATTASDATTKVVTLTTTPTYHTVTRTFTSSDANADAGLDNRSSVGGDDIAGNVIAWGAHLYRSDLGGMQANTSAYPMYNPTTPKNLLGYTEDFSNAAWVKDRSSITSNVITAPNGLSTADFLKEDSTAASTHDCYVSISSGAGTYTLSVYGKASTNQFLNLSFGSANVNYVTASFNLASGVVSASTGAGTATLVGSSISSAGDGWYRCSVTGTLAAALTNVFISLLNSGTPTRTTWGRETFDGDGTSGIYLWGAQLSDSASLDSYVPVYGAAVTSAAYYGPRRDFDGATLACKGLLVEEQRTNIVLRSQELDSGTWAAPAGVVNVTANSVTAPDGTLTADKLVPAAATNYMIKRQSVAPTAASHTFSVYGKLSDSGYHLELFTTTGSNVGAVFDLSTGAVLGSANCTTTVSSADANGWRRYSITLTANASTTYVDLRVTTASTINQSMTGNGTDGILVWGAQLEAGSFATSYIPTGAATATRLADVASVSTQAFPYSQGAGTIVVNYNYIGSSSTPYPVALDGGSVSSFIGLAHSVNALNTDQGSLAISPTLNSTGVNKVAFTQNTNDRAVSANGNAANTSTASNTPGLYTRLSIGSLVNVPAVYGINGHIRQITYLPRRVSNAELATRST